MKRTNKKGTWVITFKLCKNFDVRFERTKQKAKRTARTTSCRTFTREREDNRRRAGASNTFCKVSLVTRKFQLILNFYQFLLSQLVAAECWNHVDDWWWDSGMPGAPHHCYILGSSSYSPHHWWLLLGTTGYICEKMFRTSTQTQGEKKTIWVRKNFFSCSEPETSIGSFKRNLSKTF